MPGTPAYRLGILPNDRIAEIDGDIDQGHGDGRRAQGRMRGAPGTKVKVKILRGPDEAGEKGAWKPLEFEITRELIKIESVVSRKLDGGVGLRAHHLEFSAKTADDSGRRPAEA